LSNETKGLLKLLFTLRDFIFLSRYEIHSVGESGDFFSFHTIWFRRVIFPEFPLSRSRATGKLFGLEAGFEEIFQKRVYVKFPVGRESRHNPGKFFDRPALQVLTGKGGTMAKLVASCAATFCRNT